jgi:hypothetical protein
MNLFASWIVLIYKHAVDRESNARVVTDIYKVNGSEESKKHDHLPVISPDLAYVKCL